MAVFVACLAWFAEVLLGGIVVACGLVTFTAPFRRDTFKQLQREFFGGLICSIVAVIAGLVVFGLARFAGVQ